MIAHLQPVGTPVKHALQPYHLHLPRLQACVLTTAQGKQKPNWCLCFIMMSRQLFCYYYYKSTYVSYTKHSVGRWTTICLRQNSNVTRYFFCLVLCRGKLFSYSKQFISNEKVKMHHRTSQCTVLDIIFRPHRHNFSRTSYLFYANVLVSRLVLVEGSTQWAKEEKRAKKGQCFPQQLIVGR